MDGKSDKRCRSRSGAREERRENIGAAELSLQSTIVQGGGQTLTPWFLRVRLGGQARSQGVPGSRLVLKKEREGVEATQSHHVCKSHHVCENEEREVLREIPAGYKRNAGLEPHFLHELLWVADGGKTPLTHHRPVQQWLPLLKVTGYLLPKNNNKQNKTSFFV